MNVIGDHVKLHKTSMLATKLQQVVGGGIRQKPVIPKDILAGINNILNSNKEKIRIFRSTKARKNTPPPNCTIFSGKTGATEAVVRFNGLFILNSSPWLSPGNA